MFRKQGKKILTAALCAVCTLAMAMTAMADPSPISRLEITVNRAWNVGSIGAPGIELPVGSGLELKSTEYSQDVSTWVPGQTVQIKMTIGSTNPDKIFKDTYGRSVCKIIGNAKYVSAVRGVNDSSAVVTVDYIPSLQLGAPAKAGWSDGAKKRAVWTAVDYATNYQVKLYQGADLIKTLNVGTNNVDFSPYMNEGTSYTYEVRAIVPTSDAREYIRDGEVVNSTDEIVEYTGGTNGYWYNDAAGNMYKDASGNFLNDGWRQLDGKWYYFQADGHAKRGWFQDNGTWYYTDENCVMKTGWVLVDSKWYYLDQSGAMKTGWINPERNKWYYLYEDGSMAVTTKIDGEYKVDKNGLWYK